MIRSVVVLTFCGMVAAAAPPSPIPMAPEFAVTFVETYAGFPAPNSTGAWSYDWPRRRWRAQHDAPQLNNFCQCASNTTDTCALIFTQEARGGMYVDFPGHPELCCHLCSTADGCSVLTPGWLSASPNVSFAGESNGCNTWCVPGDYSTHDCMSYPPGGGRVPCSYTETIPGNITHELAFDRQSYVEGPQSDSLFTIRPECAKDCPSLFPSTCG